MTSPNQNRSGASAAMERLETRRLLSVTLLDRQVQVIGDDNPNEIVIRRRDTDPQNQYTVSLDGAVTHFDVTVVDSFLIRSNGGNDTITVDSSNGAISITRFIDGGDGNDTINGAAGKDKVHGGAGNDLIIGGASADELEGGHGNDLISGGTGGDFLHGGPGNDTIVGAIGNDTAFGGAGDDLISGGAGNDSLHGDDGADTIFGEDGRDFIHGGAGNDNLQGGAQRDSVYGGEGDDTVRGDGGNDLLAGDEENVVPTRDTPIVVVVGNDVISGGIGDDTLLAHHGSDTLTGGADLDVFDDRGPGAVLTDQQTPGEIRVVDDFTFTGSPAVERDITLRIFIDGEHVRIPEDAGHLPGGTSVARVVEQLGSGAAVVRFSDDISRGFTLGEFFRTWGVAFDETQIGRNRIDTDRPLTMTVNGLPTTTFDEHPIVDGQVLEIRYA